MLANVFPSGEYATAIVLLGGGAIVIYCIRTNRRKALINDQDDQPKLLYAGDSEMMANPSAKNVEGETKKAGV